MCSFRRHYCTNGAPSGTLVQLILIIITINNYHTQDSYSHTPGLFMLLLGSLSVMSSFLSIYLPETLNTSLPNTLDELIS